MSHDEEGRCVEQQFLDTEGVAHKGVEDVEDDVPQELSPTPEVEAEWNVETDGVSVTDNSARKDDRMTERQDRAVTNIALLRVGRETCAQNLLKCSGILSIGRKLRTT